MFRLCLMKKQGQHPAFTGHCARGAVCLERLSQCPQCRSPMRYHTSGFSHAHACIRENFGEVAYISGSRGLKAPTKLRTDRRQSFLSCSKARPRRKQSVDIVFSVQVSLGRENGSLFGLIFIYWRFRPSKGFKNWSWTWTGGRPSASSRKRARAAPGSCRPRTCSASSHWRGHWICWL